MASNHLILCRPLLPPSIFPRIRVFSNESVPPIRWPKYWRFSFSISPSNEHSGLISFWMDLLDLLAVQETFKSLLQHHSSKAPILLQSAFLIVQLSHPYMTTGKTIALTRQTFVGKEMSLLFNMLSRLVITFLLRSKHLLISWLQSPSAVILEPQKIVCHCFPIWGNLFRMMIPRLHQRSTDLESQRGPGNCTFNKHPGRFRIHLQILPSVHQHHRRWSLKPLWQQLAFGSDRLGAVGTSGRKVGLGGRYLACLLIGQESPLERKMMTMQWDRTLKGEALCLE